MVEDNDLSAFLARYFKEFKEKTEEGYRQDLMGFSFYLRNNKKVQKGVTDLAWNEQRAIEMLRTLFFGTGEPWGIRPATTLVREYKNDLMRAGYSMAAVNRRLSPLKSVCRMAEDEGIIDWTLRKVKQEKAKVYQNTKGPGDEVVEKMLEYLEAQPNGPDKFRDTAIVRLCFDLAMRRAEVASVDIEGVDFDQKEIWFVRKGDRDKSKLPLEGPTIEALENWIKFRKDISERGPLFIPLGGKTEDEAGSKLRLSGTSVWRVISDLGRKVGKRVWPHGIRHTTVTEGKESSQGNVMDLQQLTGHQDPTIINKHYDDGKEQSARRVVLDLQAHRKRKKEGREKNDRR